MSEYRLAAPSAARIKRVESDSGKRPEEIAFLDGRLAAAALDQAAAEAQRLNVGADRCLIAAQAIAAEDFANELAASLAIRRADQQETIAGETDWRAALIARAARRAEGGWLIAPEGAVLRELIARVTPGRTPDTVRIATPREFDDAVARRFATDMAQEASCRLPDEKPQFSARGGLTPTQWRVVGASLSVLVLGMMGSHAAWLMFCALLSLAMSLAIVVKLATVLASIARPADPPALADSDLPTYTLLVPLYREAEIAAHLWSALSRLDYPASKLQIFFLVESDDAPTAAALEALALPDHARVLRVPDGSPRTKPRALNYGLIFARGDIVAVFDAEDRPDPAQLRVAANHFARLPRNVACLQAALGIDNACENWLTRLFALDYAAQFDVLLPGLAALDLPAPLGGTSNHFRADCLRRAGAWDAWNVTEDADLGLRLARLGYRMRTILSTTWEEAPCDMRTWRLQRRRWIKGWMQTLATHLRHPAALVRDLGPGRAAHVAALLLSNALGPLVGVWFTVYFGFELWTGRLFADGLPMHAQAAQAAFASLAGCGLLAMLAPTLAGAARRSLLASLPWLLMRPLYWILLSAAAVSALRDLWARPFHWDKTQHGAAGRACALPQCDKIATAT